MLHHRLILVALVMVLAAAARGRVPPRRPSAGPASCPAPIAVAAEGRVLLRCAGRGAVTLRELLRWARIRGCAPPGHARPGQLVRVGAGCSVTDVPLPAALALTLGLRLDLNRASQADLQALPRIGPVLARRIAVSRQRDGPFASVDDLLRVKGIGPATLLRLTPLVQVVGGREPASPRATGTTGDARGDLLRRP